MDLVMRAASGGESVFDTGMLGAIIKCHRTMAQVDEYLPDLSGALDKTCRLYLLFLYKNADFSENYGSSEMASLEDVFLENIKSLGELVLFLKQRSAESSDKQTDALAGN